MKLKILLGMFFSLAVMNLTGCGGGGGGGGGAAAPPTVVSGTAAAGKFVSGTVDIFSVNAVGAKGALLKSAPLVASKYTADIGSYTGPILIEVATGSKYMDEATTTQITTTAPIRCAISNATGNTSAMVTPLTEMAVLKMTNFLAPAIDTSNANIATTFKLADITKTEPIDATDAAANAATTTTAAHKNQGLVLAAISQLGNGAKLEVILKGLSDDISGTTLAEKSVVGFKTALFNFITSANNKTGITDTATAAVNIGTIKIALVKISIGAVPVGTKIGVLDFTFNLPNSVTMSKIGATTEVATGVVTASGVASGTGLNNGSIALATLTGQTLRTVLVNAQGFGVGEIVGISCTVPAGATAPTTTSFTGLTAATFSDQRNELGAAIPFTTVFTLSATKVDVF